VRQEKEYQREKCTCTVHVSGTRAVFTSKHGKKGKNGIRHARGVYPVMMWRVVKKVSRAAPGNEKAGA
jgi:hypothetical protein